MAESEEVERKRNRGRNEVELGRGGERTVREPKELGVLASLVYKKRRKVN